MEDFDKIQKWRLILGKEADPKQNVPLSSSSKKVDKVLQELYSGKPKAGLAKSAIKVNRWLGDIRKYFPRDVVQMMQKDALERLDLKQMLLEPELLEQIEVDVHLAATLVSLSRVLPDQTKETARMVVRKVVEQIEKEFKPQLIQAIKGSINKQVNNYRPRYNEINWNRTIRANLKHYQTDHKTIIPERLIGYGKKRNQLKHLIILQDQSGSMMDSVVYAGILACVMASLPALKTNMIVFDTSVVDLSQYLEDPVELLFATRLGGGTDIQKALNYVEKQIVSPKDTIVVLISDLYDAGSSHALVQRMKQVKDRGVSLISLLALSDQGRPAFNEEVAKQLPQYKIPSFACTPNEFPRLISQAIEGKL